MKTEHQEGRYAMRPGIYRPKPGHAAKGFPPLEIYAFLADEAGEVRVLAANTSVRPLARTVVRHYHVPR